MRGLTAEERRELEDGFTVPGEHEETAIGDDRSQQVLRALHDRGLVSPVPLSDGTFFARTTDTGVLALRLDALAKGIL